jgi:hypothetical protein
MLRVSECSNDVARCRIRCRSEFPTDAQRRTIAHLANLAAGFDPTVEIVFSEGTPPFPGAILGRRLGTGSCQNEKPAADFSGRAQFFTQRDLTFNIGSVAAKVEG